MRVPGTPMKCGQVCPAGNHTAGSRLNDLSAWSENDEDSEKEKKTFNSDYEIFVDYSEYSTIQVNFEAPRQSA
jgi:hypothetical protein